MFGKVGDRGQDLLLVGAAGFVGSAIVTFIQPSKWSFGIRSRVTSTVHAVVVAALALWSFVHDFDVWSGDFIWGSDLPIIRNTVAVSVGYLAFDTLLCIYAEDIRDVQTFIHHVVVGSAFAIGLATQLATPYHCAFLINEVSTPFVNAHFFLHTSGNKGTIYKLNGFLMWLSFFLFRIVLNPYLLSTIWYTIHTPLPAARFTLAVSQTSMCLVAQVLNVVWFYKITRGLLKAVLGGGGGAGAGGKRPKAA